jgi:hypothetical protein
VGKPARFQISKDLRPTGKRSNAYWKIEVRKGSEVIETIDCTDTDQFAIDRDGMTIKSVRGQWSHRTLAVQAYAVYPERAAHVEAPVTFTSIVFSDSWTVSASQHHQPGVGEDITFGDVTEAQYRAIGKTFEEDFSDPKGLGKKTNDELFKVFRDMAVDNRIFSFTHGDLVANTNAMIDKFKHNDSGGKYPNGITEYTNTTLTKAAQEHASTERFVNAVRRNLNEMLKKLNGDAGKLPRYNGKIFSPVYNTKMDKWRGLTIAVNDTWAYEVTLVDYEFTSPSSYRAKVNLAIYDHFGLNQADIDGSTGKTGNDDPGNHEGFRAWFLLQHVRGFRPFVTKIEFEEVFEDPLI